MRGFAGHLADGRPAGLALCAAFLMLLTPIASSADRYVWAGDRQSAAPLVEVDPGHTPVRYGALGAFGDREVELNDTLAGRLCEAIIRRGLRCAVTRQPWEEITLTGRTRKAGLDGASLFISVHHDSVPEMFCERKAGWRGCTTDHASGWSVFVSKKNVHYRKSLEAAAIAGAA